MGAGAAEEKAADGRVVAGPADERAHSEKLVEGEFAMGDVAAGQTVGLLEIQRSDDEARENFRRQIGRVLRERLYDDVGQGVTLG